MTPALQKTLPSNEDLASRLDEIAGLLTAQQANPFRVQAYRRAAVTLRRLDEPVHKLLGEDGTAGLLALDGIGEGLARTIEQFVRSGHSPLLERLRGGLGSVDVFATLPGIGPELARRIHELLGVETLYELEAAAHDGRLLTVPGMGAGRVRSVRDSLAGRFQRRHAGAPLRAAGDVPSVTELLDVDREYRAMVAADELPMIAPKRLDPGGKAWLPVLHTVRGERHYTALFSNTARAHELGTTYDWVVIYRDDPGGDGQWTVATAPGGAEQGRRVVRGREVETPASGKAPSQPGELLAETEA